MYGVLVKTQWFKSWQKDQAILRKCPVFIAMGLKKWFLRGKEGAARWSCWESSANWALFPPAVRWVLGQGRWWPVAYFAVTSNHCSRSSTAFVGQQHNCIRCMSVDSLSLRACFPKSLKAGSGAHGVAHGFRWGAAWTPTWVFFGSRVPQNPELQSKGTC